MLVLHFCGAAGLWAVDVVPENIRIKLMPSGTNGKGSETTVAATEGSVTVGISGRVVTLTVTPSSEPGSGYKIKKDLIEVEKMVDPSRSSSRRRTPGLGFFELTSSSASADGWVPNSSETTATYTFTVPEDYDGAYVTATFVSAAANAITSLSDIDDLSGNYVLAQDIDASGFSGFDPSLGDFTGTLDGDFHKIYNLQTPIFSKIDGGTVKNVMLEGVDITSGNTDGDAGAICCVATGSARIYNCGILPTTTNHDKDGNVTGFEGSSVGASGNVGGIVGLLDGNARVINCFSYATITGGTMVAGIVGNIGYAPNSTITQDNVADVPMVVNCIFYGNITGGSSISPVYGGATGAMIKHEGEKGVNPYCYFRGNAPFNNNTNFDNIDKYKRSWPADEEYLTRFEYYRSILNSNRKLCTWWVSGTIGTVPSDVDVKTVGIAKWVLDPEVAPYPILKKWGKYPSIINPDPDRTWDPEANGGAGAWQDRSMAEPCRGKKLSTSLSVTTLSVTIKGGTNNSLAEDTKNIPITDMDTLNYDYGYYKIQLPYYNEVFGNPNGATHAEKYGNNYTDQVVTGWKITGITGGTQGTFTANWQTGYNFADRNCTNKDLYSVSNRVFAQGGFFYVPEGVSAITIEAYWGKAVYLHNNGHYIDRVNITNQSPTGSLKLGNAFTPTGKLSNKFQGQDVYDSWTNAVKALDAATLSGSGDNRKLDLSVYDQAIVLLSNVQWRNENNAVGTKIDSKWHPYTIMSIDEDMDNEPDYCFELQFRRQWARPGIQPIRFDFLPVPELGMAVRYNQNQNTIGIFVPQGHFEITETSYMHTTQFEYDAAASGGGNGECGTKVPAPIILNGGHFEQIVGRYGPQNTTQYFLMGGHFRMLRFTPGAHTNTSQSAKMRLCAVNCIGGDYPELYLSGIYRPDITPTSVASQGNPHCYTNGGHFGLIAGAGYDKILGDITFKIDHSLINEFYGGGINGSNPVGGNIDVTINNSLVNKYCGGPKIGAMVAGKTVTTHATGTIFGRYYGGGNGGTSYYREQKTDNNTALPDSTASSWGNKGYSVFNPLNSQLSNNKYYEGPETAKNRGYHALFEFECFVESNGLGEDPTVRAYIHWAQFGTTSTGNTTNVLDNCTVKQDFYGGGNLGNVNGDVNSTLTNCTIEGNAFAGGYSGTIEPFRVHDRTKTRFPYVDVAGIMQRPNGVFQYVKNDDGSDRYYTWCYKNPETKVVSPAGVVIPEGVNTNNPTFQNASDGKWYVLTTVSLEGLGAVSGKATINIEGETQVKGSVFGGGNESAVDGGTEVNVDANVGEIAYNCDNVYGGGNTADVVGDTEVNVLKGVVKTDVFGGGKGSTTVVDGSVTVNIGKDEGETLSGEGIVSGDVYGGSALGAVNAASLKNPDGTITGYTPSEGKTTTVNIYKGTVTGRVFGGGLGHDDEVDANDIAAQNFRNTTVNMRGGTAAAVYGGANENGVLKQDAIVEITGGTIGKARTQTSDPVLDVVFGGGLGQPTLVEGDVTVNVGSYYAIGGSPTSTPTIYGNAYGGSALGNVNASKTDSNPISYVETKKVDVNLYSGTIYGNVFGGCLGRKAVAESGTFGQEGYVAPVAAIEAFVGGDVTVILDGAKLDCVFSGTGGDRVPLTGQIFGCNNWNGTPLGHVLVHVKRTVDSAKPDDKDRDERITYDVAAVYGGGNQADYVPRNALLNPAVEANKAKFEAARAQVIIEGCDLTSIEYVYGGGNAASVPATEVIVRGTYIIDYLFGGGNGKSTSTFTNPGADIGLRAKTTDGTAYENDPSKEAYGTGRAVSKLIAGKIHVVFGGSNTKGNVRQGTSVTMPQESGSSPAYCSEIDIREIYGAGQNADQDGGVDLVLGCVKDMDVVYGGAKDAHIAGGINLTITSGKFKQIFGGNNESGTIQGPITLNIEETACDPIEIEELYLGGNKAAYSIYGYYIDTDDSNKIKPRTSADDSHTQMGSTSTPYRDPILNVVSCTSIGNVYGGGLGAGAVMYGSPTLNMNMIPGDHAADIDRDGTEGPDNDAEALGAIGNVFGGGKEAAVYGNATININTEQKVTLKSIEDKPETTDVVENEFTVTGAYITGNIYGGGQDAVLSGNTQVSICAKEVEVDDKMVWQIVPEGSAGVNIAGAVFGAGKGESTTVNNTVVVMGAGSVGKSVYGGGEYGSVNVDSKISIMGGEIGDKTGVNAGATYGNVYGGGMGECDKDKKNAGLIKGNTTIDITGGTIYHNVYGGGAYGSVGTYTVNEGVTTCASGTGVARITITGGTIGINGKENGMVFGSSRGEVAKPTGSPAVDPNDYLATVDYTYVTIGTADSETGPTINGSVYGSGENGHTFHNTSVTIHSGTIGLHDGSADDAYRGNVYGGGCGTDKYDSDNNGTKDTYNPKSGIVYGNTKVVIDGGKVNRNVYGAGAMGSVDGSTSIEIKGGTIGVDGNDNGFVYAAARGDETITDEAKQAHVGATSLEISGDSKIMGSAYGGGQAGIVKGAVVVSMTGGKVFNDVYGGGALARTNTVGSYEEVTSGITAGTTLVDGYFTRSGAGTNESPYVYAPASGKAVSETKYYRMLNTTTITLNGAEATIGGTLYGGGLGDKSSLGAGHADIAADVCGNVTVNFINGKADNVFGCNNVNGSPLGTVTVNVSGGTIEHNLYGGGNQAAYTYAHASAPQNLKVNISGGTMDNVYGGGLSADVAGGIDVKITGGTITNDVYGGGALANTNTANWVLGSRTIYIEATDLTVHTAEVKGTTVTGLYVKTPGDSYVLTEDIEAQDGTTYYEKRDLPGNWAAGKTSASHTTSVALTGGVVGNVYGGGLGASDKPVYVFGDITVTVNKDGDKSASFTNKTENVTMGGTPYTSVPITGRVFGCNNVKGTPLGDVLVEIYATVTKDEDGTVLPGHKNYEILAVYGGGNQADYLPDYAPGHVKETKVNIYGCDDTSIARVYGGGNSASVPSTNVTIWGTYDIEYAFGGGNGGQPVYTIDKTWVANSGANVNGAARITCHGGKIGQVFGGSDFKGDCYSANPVLDQQGTCPLVITKLYGAGSEATVNGNVNVVVAACTGENSQIEYVCGGSYKAYINGNVTLTITSGYFKNVYGGNDQRGGIEGNIEVNIEETDPCDKPIIIGNLVGGGNQANFPGTDEDGNALADKNPARTITVNVKSATRIDNVYGGSYMAATKANTYVNINMLRGNKNGLTKLLPADYGIPGAEIPGNISNISVTYEVIAIEKDKSVVGYYTQSGSEYIPAEGKSDGTTTYYEKKVTGKIAAAIGTIGNVFGGGKQGSVDGNTQVNIGTSTTVPIMERDEYGNIVATYDAAGKITSITYEDKPVLGAHITGDVFGGGEEAVVTGNTTVNICAVETSPGVYAAVAEGSEKVNIGGVYGDKKYVSSVYGGGRQADVKGNTTVRMSNGFVYNGIFGGGLAGSVGTYTDWDKELITDKGTDRQFDHSSHECSGKPKTCKTGTGKCTVVVNGGQIGPVEVATHGMERITNGHGNPVSEGWVWGGSRGLIEDPADDPDTHFKSYVNETDVTIGGTAFILESIIGGGEFGRVLGNTLVKIEGGQIGVGYKQTEIVGGVLKPKRYEDSQFIDPTTNTITAGEGGNALNACSHYPYGRDTNGDGKPDEFLPFDPYYDDEDFETYINSHPDFSPASTDHPSDGKTWIGCVFGGGSGYMPYKIKDKTDKAIGYAWCRSAGWVEGNSTVEISGGHILTNVYGANEYTDVSGTSTVRMTGGTIGVPRTLDSIAAQPLICYLFGAGKGDERAHFNQMTNTGNVVVDVSGGIIYGSVFGGSEDGHVLGDVSVTIRKGDPFTIGSKTYNDGPIIGTWGTSYVDGNVFGGGRGFSGKSLVAGVVSGNVNVNIQGGTMLGSIYGGGRLAAVGTYLVPPSYATYGTLIPDGKEQVIGGDDITKAVNHGRITVNITGGTIGGGKPAGTTTNGSGKKISDINYSGNVFGGCMGRLTLLNDAINDNWPMLALAATATVNISGGTIHRNVYGGGEFGTLRDGATVDISGGTVNRNVYGGGLGSDDNTNVAILKLEIPGYSAAYRYTPMQWAGCVGGDTHVNISGGWVKKNVYGGGELASVGVIDFTAIDSDNDGEYEYTNIKRHDNIEGSGTTTEKIYDFGLSWPYHLPYYTGYNSTAHVTVTGGRIGLTGKDDLGSGVREDNGDIYGGGKGIVAPRYDEAFCANVYNTVVTINYDKQATKEATPTNYKDNTALGCIAGSVYGGGENGHVMNNTSVTLTNGLIGHAIYGGGKGKDTFRGSLKRATTGTEYETDIFSVTAGKVYGNTSVSMTGGYVVRNIYGGGNMASVGKGNYAGGSDDYSTKGYGELPPQANQALWSNSDFMGSGKTTVSVTGGQVGTVNGTKDDLPTGNVFGGCRGASSPNITNSPRYLYSPVFYSGYVNETDVTIGTENQATNEATAGQSGNAPRIYGSVYGGGQDGHVRRDAKVTFYSGVVGNAYTDATAAASLVGTSDQTNLQWLHRGNVYGSGSGIGKYEYDFNGNGKTFTDADSDEEYDEGEDIDTGEYGGATVKDIDYSNASGSVSRFTTVDILGGIIHRNVYGGGSLAPVGAPKIPPISTDPIRRDDTSTETVGKQSLNKVSISSGTIGEANYGGDVFGACRGQAGLDKDKFATSVWTEVNILPYKTGENTYDYSKNPIIYNNVYGGGELGNVRQSTHVNLKGGEIKHDAYGGGRGIKTGNGVGDVAADIGGNATVLLNENLTGAAKGCIVNKVFGCNDYCGTPKGHVLVHVFATQHKDKDKISSKYDKYRNFSEYIDRYNDYVSELDAFATTFSVDISSYKTDLSDTNWGAQPGANDDEKKANLLKKRNNALDDIRNALAAKYDVLAVYGGGDLAPYEPTNNEDNTEVIIDGCELTSIKQVYGSGNAASTSACSVTVYGTYEIDELFGGGNGKDDYQLKDGKWYENPGANVGYRNFTHYVTDGTHGSGSSASDPYQALENDGTDGHPKATSKEYREANYSYGLGKATTNVIGGRIHNIYGGSNEKGNIRSLALSVYESSTECPLVVDNSYGAGKNAPIDGEARISLECVDYMARLFGGSTNSDVNSDVTLTVTNGVFSQVFGGNDTSGKIYGSITVNIKESGCKPIIIDELYGGGYLADYSIYGYYKDDSDKWQPRSKKQFKEAKDEVLSHLTTEELKDQDIVNDALIEAGLYGFPKNDPRINVISATKIGQIYGGGYRATVVGSPHVNVNMENGMVPAKWAKDNTDFAIGDHQKTASDGKNTHDYKYSVADIDAKYNAILALGTIDNIFGGGNEANILGNTYVDIGTGEWLDDNFRRETTDAEGKRYTYNETTEEWDWVKTVGDETTSGSVSKKPVPSRKAAFINGNVYGGGNMGHVGNFTLTAGKPTSCTDGTGICHVTISNGDIGPNNMNMWHLDGGNVPASDKPDDSGHVFGACKGTNLPADDNAAYVDSTIVTIDGTAWVKGSVFGGGENGHVLHDTDVTIDEECQIGNGHILLTSEDGTIIFNRGVNRRYTAEEWASGNLTVTNADFTTTELAETSGLVALVNAKFAGSLPECDSWLYGKEISAGKVVESAHHAPYDMFEGTDDGYDAEGGTRVASSGRAFNGNVFGGGSGYFPYAAGQWNSKAGSVEGNTTVKVKGGHIMTSLYGGCEMSSMLGDTHVIMSGGTLGVPRTLEEIDAHPVTCYVFGGGKGEGRALMDNNTDVRNATVDITGGWVYGSVFGGAEDGHVLGNATVNISGAIPTSSTTYEDLMKGDATKIGTWGTSYVDGNIFGGGRGFDGHNKKAGRVAGNANINISGGLMLGSVYGGGRLGSVGMGSGGTISADEAEVLYTAEDAEVKAGTKNVGDVKTPASSHGHITVNITGGTIGNDLEFVIPDKDEGALAGIEKEEGKVKEVAEWTKEGENNDWDKWKAYKHVPNTEYDTSNGRVTHTKGGNVFAGSMGRRKTLSGSVIDGWTDLGAAKSTKLTIGGDAWIMSNVYGGGEFGPVTGNHTTSEKQYGTEIIINGGTIGTEVTGSTPVKETIPTPTYSSTDSPSSVQYTFGSVYGGGYGTEAEIESISEHADVYKLGAFVSSNTLINMTTGLVRASVFGGGELAGVGGDAEVTISGGKIGRDEVHGKNSANPGYVRFGSSTMGNVYGGGKGKNTHTLLGVVKGNATVNINPGANGEPFIYHNVYGGGALGSLGTFIFSDGVTGYVMSNIPKGIPYHWINDKTGVATVNIKGGTIGISGRDNGMVNGSSRGDIAKPVLTVLGSAPEGEALKDPYDKMAWVQQSIVNIGETGEDGPHIKGSVYGGGENGHVFTHATVNVKSGTIGIVDKYDTWFDFVDPVINEKAWVTRGNVYGAGCGTDTYWDDKNNNSIVDDGEEHHNTWAGCVIGNVDVNISGGWVAQSVYGGGSLGSVGRILEGKDEDDNDNIVEHRDDTNGFAISWPVEFKYQPLTVTDPVEGTTDNGKTTVNITGGRIGTTGSDNGDVFGGTRGEAGADRYLMAQLANVKETYVNINYPESNTATPDNYKSDLKQQCITGSVYGGSENGHVNMDTHVLMNNGLVGHAIYGGGKGKSKVSVKLVKIGAVKKDGTSGFNIEDFEDKDVYDAKTYSFTAGKVYGNTYVDMRGGYVVRNIYGGGNMASVGKGNYAGGPDDYFTLGYGELTGTKNLWTSAEEGDLAWHFLNTGKTNVTVTGGQVGYIASDPTKSIKDGLPYGNIFGGCRGEATPNINEIPPYLYNPTFYSGFVNETNVNIGGDYRCIKKCTDENGDVHFVGSALHLDSLKNAFDVETPDAEYWEAIAGDGPKIYGSVYGGGQDGHVRRDAHVTVNKGEIGILYDDTNRGLVGTSSLPLTEELDSPQWLHRGNVYGSGSGNGKYEYDFNGNHSTYTDDNDNGEYDEGETVDEGSYGDETVKDIDYGISAGSVTRFSQVDIFGGTIYRNVYGGGSRASVGPPFMGAWALKRNDADASTKGKQSQCTVNIKGTVGVPLPKTESETDKYNEVYGGEVYGASRGDETVGDNFATCVWTQVNLKNGAVIRGNVFGGGDAGTVKKDSEVFVGNKKVTP